MPQNLSLRPRNLSPRLRPRYAALLGLAALSALAAPAAPAQSLFVTNYAGDSNEQGTITEFAAGLTPGTFGTVTSFTDPSLGHPYGPAFDSKGDLFVANPQGGSAGTGSITEFAAGAAPGTFGKVTSFTDNSLTYPFHLALDAGGDLFVANSGGGSAGTGSITEFAAGAAPGTFGPATSFTDPSLDGLAGLAFDSKGDLFAVNAFSSIDGQGSITEFAAGATPGTFGPVTSFTDPSLRSPISLAFDARGDLFTTNLRGGSNEQGSFTEFAAGAAPGTFGPVTTFAAPNTYFPNGLAFDARGDLFATATDSFGHSSITEFAAGLTPGTFGKITSFSDPSLDNSTGLAFGPSAPSSPVPEASSVVSLGLLLMLGLGGVAVARRRSVRA